MTYHPLYGSLSPCHQSPSLIVRSREGGFVTQNCISCGEPRTLPFDEIPALDCSDCGTRLDSFINIDKNYAYKCPKCFQTYKLASIVPHWSERFKYHGFGLDSDYEDDFHRL